MQRVKQQNSFTLAEVLITIGIIGVVAAITIPVIVLKSQKIQTLSQLKKTYATLQVMYQKAVADNGLIDDWGLSAMSDGAGMVSVYQNIIAQYLNVSKYCGTTNTNNACWAYGYDFSGTATAAQPTWNGVYITLVDGTSIVFEDSSNSWSGAGGAYNYWISIYIDINGLKKPNRLGKDRFIFEVDSSSGYSNRKIVPRGTCLGGPGVGNEPDRMACWNSGVSGGDIGTPGSGDTCAYTIIRVDQWQIADDYPW